MKDNINEGGSNFVVPSWQLKPDCLLWPCDANNWGKGEGFDCVDMAILPNGIHPVDRTMDSINSLTSCYHKY